MGRLDGKVALVTGGGYGIGRATSVLFAKEGAKVVIADSNVATGEETVKTIKTNGGQATFVQTDVSKAADVERMVKVAVDTFGKLDILFNNAGILGKIAPTAEYDEQEFDRIIAINVKGVWLGMKYAIPEMIKIGGGSIINVASHVAYQPQIGTPIYCASKAAVLHLSRVTALEYIHRNIRVNWINPGYVYTSMLEEGAKADPGGFKRLIAQLPLNRTGKAEEVANAVLLLASDESSYMTGSGVTVDGGISLVGCPRFVERWW